MTAPLLLLGAGRMGGALIQGWSLTGAFAAPDLILCDPHPGPEARAAVQDGARLNPGPSALAEAGAVLMAVKPQIWREAVAPYLPALAPDAVVVSIAAGVTTKDLASAFGSRRIARVMPTTAVAVAKGTASIYAADTGARAIAHALFAPVATVADLAEETLMDVATAVSGSAPAYLYAFLEALEDAGVAEGLTRAQASALARSTIVGAAALLEQSEAEPAELRRQVTSPGGTTEAALNVLLAENGFPSLMKRAVAAAVARAKELSK
jgi:pyrroline-5-carboxylate reductase